MLMCPSSYMCLWVVCIWPVVDVLCVVRGVAWVWVALLHWLCWAGVASVLVYGGLTWAGRCGRLVGRITLKGRSATSALPGHPHSA